MSIEQPSGQLDQLIRQTRQHHIQLSAMADLKANMLLTIASVVITLSVRYTITFPFQWAAAVLIAFCFITLLLATYATMPKLHLRSRPAPNSSCGEAFNLLFFGDFAALGYDQFVEEMEEMMSDPGRAYRAQLKDIYTLGRYLAEKKYRYVRFAYFTFIIGLVSSGAVLIYSAFFFEA